MFKSQTFYAPELGCDITVRGLSAAGVYRLNKVTHSALPDGARKVAIMAEHLRDGVVAPPIAKNNNGLLDFIDSHPELAVRAFAAIRHLTEANGEQGS